MNRNQQLFNLEKNHLIFSAENGIIIYSIVNKAIGIIIMKILISETTREERDKIVEDSLGNMYGGCDGCMPGIAEMYQPYIDGEKELRDINMEFTAHYVKAEDMPIRQTCIYSE